MKHRLRSFLKSAFFLAFLLPLMALIGTSIYFPATAQGRGGQSDRSEIRGVWITNVDSNVLFDRDRLSNAVQELAKLNFNTLYPTVWNWGYTLYPSSLSKSVIGSAFDPRPLGLENRDPIAEFVQQGHKKGMAVIPWFEFGFMAPEDSALAMRHPDWLTQRQDGTTVWMEGIYPRVWLNPFQPEVQQFIAHLVLEVVTKYDIDGIQLDDHFGLPNDFGYDNFTVQLYQNEHQGKSPPTDPKDPEWTRWRANKITDFLTQIFRAVKAKKKNVLVALSPNDYDFSYHHSLQDWRTWERQGLIEELVLQVYQSNLDAFTAKLKALELQNARRHIPTGIGILSGLKRRTIPMKQIQEQVQAVRDQGFAGVSFFFYETLWNLVSDPAIAAPEERLRRRKAGFQSLFPSPAARPTVRQHFS
jgi:uncharacterized lipoprotein YddW (UPF0748 family)